MKINLSPEPGYWDWTHDQVIPGEFNCPDNPSTWDMEGGNDDDPDPKVRLNGSDPMDIDTLGMVIKKMVALARTRGCGDYEVVDLSPGR